MTTHVRKDSKIESESETRPNQRVWKAKDICPSTSPTTPPHRPSLPATLCGSDTELRKRVRFLDTDIEANKRLAHHIRTRPQMEVEERVLRTEIFWLSQKIADRRRVYGGRAGDYTEKSERLRWQFEEKRWQLKKLKEKRRAVDAKVEEIELCNELAEAMSDCSLS